MDGSVAGLSREQAAAMDDLRAKRSIFITGGGGVGKTFFISAVRQWCEQERGMAANEPDGGTAWFTATTGVA